MPLLVYYNAAWNGPATIVVVDQVSTEEEMIVRGLGSVEPDTQIAVLTEARVTALKNSAIETQIVVDADGGSPKGKARILLTVDVAASPSAYDISQAVWAQQLAGFTQVGSAGKGLTDAGAGGNPWSADIASNNTSGTFGWLIQKLLKLAQFLGLK